jgi:XTP/dITP diphosphohydrolase
VRTYVATHNPGKLREIKALFAGSPIAPLYTRKYGDVIESADSYEGNALLKAQALMATLSDRKLSGRVLADDSGLEIDALSGGPGIYSARYGGPDLSWPERRAALLGDLRGVPPYRRTARFVSVLVLLEPDREPLMAMGRVNGYILESERGTGGFGYDPIFLYPPAGVSFATLSEKEKNAVSHRRRAADVLLAMLRERG